MMMKALKVTAQGKAEVQDVPIPALREGRILVKVNAVALNPTDWKHIDFFSYVIGSTIGCDYSGTIVSLGPNVDSTKWKVGDRIAGVVHGCDVHDLETGSFAEYVLADDSISFKPTENISDEEAATFGVAISTVGQALCQSLNLPLPGSVGAGFPVSIHGASSATGTIAVQFAKLSGANVVATCSPKNFDFVKSLGADEVFNYNDKECAAKIREYTHGQLAHVLDCIGGDNSARICTDSMGPRGGHLASISPGQTYPRGDVRIHPVLAYSISGTPYRMGEHEFPAKIEDHIFGSVFWRLAADLICGGKIKAHPQKVGQGLEGVLGGLDQMRKGEISGVKLVYRL